MSLPLIVTAPEQLKALLALRAQVGLRLGELLVVGGRLPKSVVDFALAAKAAGRDGRLGDILVSMRAISREGLDAFIEQCTGTPLIDLRLYPMDAAAVAVVPPASAHMYQCLPAALFDRTLVGVFAAAPSADQVAALRFATGHPLVPFRATDPELLRDLILRTFPNPQATYVKNAFIEKELYAKLTSSTVTSAGFFRSLVAHAITNGASDIHLRPLVDGSADVFIRVDGLLRPYKNVSQKQVSSLVRHIEIMAGIDFMSKTASKEGRLAIDYDGRQVDLRVSVIPGPSGDSVVLRVLDPVRFPASIADLALPPAQLQALSGILMRPHGLLVAVGPTGSGKTTTLYTMLRELEARNLHVVTAEDPVEYRLKGINQFPTKDFAALLPQLLRHDPDVVMVGELRDEKTVTMAVNAALTGHLVLSTVHANDAASTVHRLIGLGAPMHVLTSSLAGILGQRLVRLTCRSCQGAGCAECGRTGYRGRALVAELAKPRASMSQMSGLPSHAEVLRHLEFLGGVTLNDSILKLARSGQTTWQEAAGLVTDPALLPLELRQTLGYVESDDPASRGSTRFDGSNGGAVD